MPTSAQFISGVSATNNSHVFTGTAYGPVNFGDNESEYSSAPALDSWNRKADRRLWLDSSLNRLSYAVEAPFNAYNRRHEPTCLPETRVDLLQQIYVWAEGRDERFIFWLNGLAGTGKFDNRTHCRPQVL
jgi:hypothetical protein